ncbi:MAG TPA: peptidoglycan editing factor PgeF [Paracoccaceae bacterium]|nr:peptidoglycan editing factor PgeF [Paracoccaceae bacterium]
MTLEILTSPLLGPVRHGFFTRKGGLSEGLYAGLNCGPGSGDAAEMVAANRARAAAALDLAPGHLVSLNQVHSAEVVTLAEPPTAPARADAMVTDRPGIGLAILAADCAPVLLADPAAGVIGAAHAGWRGALAGVLEAVVGAMQDMGATRIAAAIGPCISQRAYEVGPDFLDAFLAEDPDNSRFFAQGRGDRLQFDLPGFVLSRLRTAGVTAEWIGHCTFSDPGRFFSFRRTTQAGEPDYGRLASVIRL